MNATSCKVTVLRQSTVAADIRCLTVQWPDASRPAKAGQFFMLRAWAANETPILSRPISVHDFDAATGALTFLYQVKGEGTQKLAALKEGDTLTVTGPCGNGFDVAAIARAAGGKNGKIAVVGGGIGTAPLLQLCKELAAAGCKPELYCGFRDEPYGLEDFPALLRRHQHCNGFRRGGLPRPGNRHPAPGTVRHGADLRPHGDDARRIPAVRPERHALRGQPGTQDGLRPWRLPGLHLPHQGGGQDRM